MAIFTSTEITVERPIYTLKEQYKSILKILNSLFHKTLKILKILKIQKIQKIQKILKMYAKTRTKNKLNDSQQNLYK